MVDTGGVVVARYAYDPYGQSVVKSGPAAEGNPWRYTAGYWDAGVGLYKLGARYYDPARGRFTQVDPLGGGYVYASDNPVNFVDPSGLSAAFAGGLFDYSDPNTGPTFYGVAASNVLSLLGSRQVVIIGSAYTDDPSTTSITMVTQIVAFDSAAVTFTKVDDPIQAREIINPTPYRGVLGQVNFRAVTPSLPPGTYLAVTTFTFNTSSGPHPLTDPVGFVVR